MLAMWRTSNPCQIQPWPQVTARRRDGARAAGMPRLALRALALVALWIGTAHAQPGPSTSEILRDGNTAALAGDWPRVSQLVEPLLQHQLTTIDLGETHRLAGIAAFFEQHNAAAEEHFLAYLRLDLAGRLDPALYPPEVVAFFNDVASRHAAELRALRSRAHRSWLLTLLPPFGQLQNGERTKAYVLGGALGGLLVANLTTYYFLRAWCEDTSGPVGGGLTCYNGGDHNHAAARLRPYNIATGIGFLVVYAYGVFDGVQGYRRQSHNRVVQPFANTSADSRVFGLMGSF
jgi:hypothetical protein